MNFEIMNFKSIVRSLWDSLKTNRLNKLNKNINLQKEILKIGIESTAEIYETKIIEQRIGKLFPVQLSLKLLITHDKYIYTKSNTLISINKIPKKGDVIRIKYLPNNWENIVIL